MLNRFRKVSALSVLLAAVGCSNDVTGRAASYDPVVPEPVAVTMPQGAYWITQQFAPSQPEVAYSHRGVDVRAPAGVPVVAAAPGRVIRALNEPMHGQQVVVDHGVDSDGARVVTRYHHLRRTDVRVGQDLARGEQIGLLGSSGIVAVAEHLHFELRRGPTELKADPVDPQLYWVDGVGKVTCFDPARRYPALPVRLTYPVPCR